MACRLTPTFYNGGSPYNGFEKALEIQNISQGEQWRSIGRLFDEFFVQKLARVAPIALGVINSVVLISSPSSANPPGKWEGYGCCV
jgi:hypothetical protein